MAGCPCCRVHKTRRLRALFERMDRNRSGTLTLGEFREYLARENPRSTARAAALFRAMAQHGDGDGDEGGGEATVSFLEACSSTLKPLSIRLAR